MAATKTTRGKDWTFTLNSTAKGEYTLVHNPIGWDAINFALSRQDQKDGIFVSFSADLEFVKDGYDYIKDIIDNYGILENVTLTIRERGVLVNESKLDFTSIIESPNARNGIKVPLLSDQFTEKIKAREDIDIPYKRLEDLDGNAIVAQSDEFIDAELYGMAIVKENIECSVYETTYDVNDEGANNVAQIIAPDGYDLIQIKDVTQRPYTMAEDLTNLDCFVYAKSKMKVILNFDIDFSTHTNVSSVNLYKLIFSKVTFDQNGTYISKSTIVFQEGTGNLTYNFSGSNIEVSLEKYEGIYFYVYTYATNLGATVDSWITISDNYINVNFAQQNNPTQCNLALIWEVHNRMVEAITGQTDSFVSTVFDRAERGATADGKWGHLALTNGKLIRQFTTDESNLTFKPKDLMADCEKMLNVSYGIIYDNGYKLIAEDKQYFYQSDIVYEITGIKAESFTREFDSRYWYSAILAGTEKSAYEEVSGLEEFNNKSSWSTILSTIKNELDLVSKTRNDGYGVTFAQRLDKTYHGTEDSQYDNENWLIELIKDGTWKQRTDEDFASIEGIDGIDTPLNLNLTPARSLYRWGWWLRACLSNYLTKKIKFNKADVISDLRTLRNDESISVGETADIDPNDLQQPIFTGYVFKFAAPIELAEFQTLMTNPYGLVSFENPITETTSQGWIIEVSTSPIEEGGQSNWTILESKTILEIIRLLQYEDGDYFLFEDGNYYLEFE